MTPDSERDGWAMPGERDRRRTRRDGRPGPSRSKTRVRLFVAAYPPPGWAERARALLDAVELPAFRATPPEQVHLTLLFVGEVEPAAVDGVVESVGRAAGGVGAFDLTPARLVSLPRRGPSRLVALETDAPGRLPELVRRLAMRLADRPRKDPADRFLPHLTLCRFREPGPVRVDLSVELDAFRVGEIRLMRSVLRPAGAEHLEVGRFGLE